MVAEQLSNLDLVLQQDGLKVKLEKCSFFKKEVQYLGHMVSEEGVSSDLYSCQLASPLTSLR